MILNTEDGAGLISADGLGGMVIGKDENNIGPFVSAKSNFLEVEKDENQD